MSSLANGLSSRKIAMRARSLRLAALLLVASATTLSAQAKDSIRTRPFFTWRDAAILEAFAIVTVAAAPLDTRFANRIQRQSVQETRWMERTSYIVENITDPGSFIIGIGMYGYGRLRDNQRAADLGLHGTEALFIGAQFGNLLKGIVGRARPYVDVDDPHNYQAFRGFNGGSDYRAFPSGHTISAFAAAAAVTSETKRWWPKSVWLIAPVMYVGAATVAWSRMYENKHWASDVLTGSAIGTFTGLKVVHFHHHTKPGNRMDRFFLGDKLRNTNIRFVIVPGPPAFRLPPSAFHLPPSAR